jgi:hypothetical protein
LADADVTIDAAAAAARTRLDASDELRSFIGGEASRRIFRCS